MSTLIGLSSGVTGVVSALHKGKELEIQWKIQDLDYLSMDTYNYYVSPSFTFEGETWSFYIWPNGSKYYDTVGYIDLYLEKSRWPEHLISVACSFAIRNSIQQNEFERHCTGRNYALRRFLSRSEYKRRKSELLHSGSITVICRLKKLDTIWCSYCKENFQDEFLPLHKKCIERPLKCPDCSNVVPLKNWLQGHECQKKRTQECSYCKKNVDVVSISTHEKKCTDRPIKCPECSEVLSLQKWCDHECQSPAAEKCSYCKKSVDVVNISTHEKKSMDRPIKCPECLEVLVLQKWCDHQCQSPAAEGIESLRQDFKNVLLDGCDHDLILKTNDREFRAHKDVLRARSSVFKSMLSHDMVEKNSGVINLPDCDPRAMEQFLLYLYSGKVDSLDQSNMNGLYYIADKYEMKDLKEECSKFIKESLSTTNFCSVIQLATNHSDFTLLDFAVEYFENHMLDIFCTVEWQLFLKENSTIANELLIKSHKKE